jgi:hypothetical protein
MPKLMEATASLSQACAALRSAREKAGNSAADVAEILKSINADLDSVAQAVRRAQSELASLRPEELAADAAKDVAELSGFVTAARLVTRADVDRASAAVRDALETFAKRVDVGEVSAIDKDEANELIRSFQADIEARASW